MAGKRNLTHTGYLAQVQAFYQNLLINKEALKGLAEYSITKAKLKAGFEL